MADSKLTALTANTTPASTDLLFVVSDPAGTPVDRKSTLAQVVAAGLNATLAATTASFTTADETKLDGIEAGADVTDATNVAAAGAAMLTNGGTFAADIAVPDEAYDATTWNGSTEVPTKNAIRDKIETLSSAELIGVTSYDPGTALTVSTTSGTFADVDATNLAVSFTVPASGTVLVRLTGSITTGSGTQMGWGLREGTTNLNDGTVAYAGASALELQPTITFRITGLTPGAAKTFKWSHARVFGSGTCSTRCGGGTGSNGPATMEVWAAT